MKILVSTLILSCQLILFGQNNCINNISTNPHFPESNISPFFNGTNENTYYLNNFDWINRDPEFGVYAQYQLNNMEYAGIPILEMENIMDASSDFYQYIWSGPDHFPENGWELLLVNLGFFPNGQELPSDANSGDSMPYIVLYNKYSGLIRVFVNFGLDHSLQDGAESFRISLKYEFPSTEMSGLMRLNQGSDQTLDNTSNIKYMSSIVQAPLDGQQWASADFQVAFDPCTCFYPSRLILEISEINEANIEFYGRELEFGNQSFLNSNNEINPSALSFLSGFEYNEDTKDVSDGLSIYKVMGDALDVHIARLNKYKYELAQANLHNQRVKDNLLILKSAKYTLSVILLGGKLGTVIEAAGTEGLTLWQSLEQLGKGYTLIEDGVKKINTSPLLKAAKHILNEAGETWVSNNFELKTEPSPPTEMSTISFTEARYVGNISNQTPLGNNVVFYTPGTYGTFATGTPDLDSFDEYPAYNEILGTFALLESPKILVQSKVDNIEEIENITLENSSPPPGSLVSMSRHQWDRQYSISLDEQLKFAFNDALDIENIDIEAAFSVKALPKLIDTFSEADDVNFLSSYYEPQGTHNIEANNFDLASHAPILASRAFNSVQDFDNISSLGFSTSEFENFPYQFSYEFDLVTPFVPIDAFSPFSAGFALRNELFSEESSVNPNQFSFGLDFEIDLLLQIDVEFQSYNNLGEKNSTTLLLKYDVLSEDINYIHHSSPYAESLDFEQIYPQTLYFSDTNFDGSTIDNCELQGDVYECKSSDQIIIDGNISVASPFSVEFIAENEINVLNNSELPNEVLLTIEDVFNYSQPMPPATLNDVISFCEGTNGNAQLYQANISSRATENQISELPKEKNKENLVNTFDVQLFPNPSSTNSEVFIVSASAFFDKSVGILIADATGRKKEVKTSFLSENRIKLNTENLSSGLYLVRLVIGEKTIVKQLIIN